MNNGVYKDKRLLDAIELIDDRFIAEVTEIYKNADAGGVCRPNGRAKARIFLRYAASVACIAILAGLMVAAPIIIKLIGGGPTPPVGPVDGTESSEIDEPWVDTEDDTGENTEEQTEEVTTAPDPNDGLPELQLTEPYSLSELYVYRNVKLQAASAENRDKLYHIRMAFFTASDREVLGLGLYFDAVDAVTNEVVGSNTMRGAFNVFVKYAENSNFGFRVSRVSYMETSNPPRIYCGFEYFFFTDMSSTGAQSTIQTEFFHGTTASEHQSITIALHQMDLFMSEKYRDINFEVFTSRAEDYFSDEFMINYDTFISNDPAFLAYCGDRKPTAALLAEMWDSYSGNGGIRRLLIDYGIGKE